MSRPSKGDGLDTIALLLLVVGAFALATYMVGRANAAQSALEAEINQARLEGRVIDIPLESIGSLDEWPDWREGE